MPICVPGRKLRVYAVISRVRATGPRLLFANVVINVVVDPVGTAGLEPALSCSHDHAVHGARRAAAALHPVNQSERADLNRRSPGPPPTSRVPGRDARLRYVLMSVARAGVEPALPPTTAARRCPRAMGARSTQSKQGLARRFHTVDSHGARIRVYGFSGRRQPTLRRCPLLSYRPKRKKPDVVVTPGFRYSRRIGTAKCHMRNGKDGSVFAADQRCTSVPAAKVPVPFRSS